MTFREFNVGTAEYEAAWRLRDEVLRIPLGLQLSADDQARDTGCFHLGGFEGADLQAVLLLQPSGDGTVQMRQVAVRPGRQGTGAGRRLIVFAEEFARQHGYQRMIAHARGTALGFYLRLGYEASGEEFMEQTIPHRLVVKEL